MDWYKIVNEEKKTKIYIYDAIGKYEVSAQKFIQELEKSKDRIELHLNSPGGAVFEGFAIYNAIKQSEKTVDVYIDGLAASIASVIAMAGDKIYIAKNATIMIHNVSAGAHGEKKELEKTIKVMKQLEEQIQNIYVERTGLPKKEIQEMMDTETWMTAKVAVEKGFADEVIETNAKNTTIWNLANYDYRNIPKNIQEESMDELEKVKNELKDVKTQFEAKNTKITELENIINSYRQKELENKVADAIKSGKLLPSQKDWAIKLGAENEKALDEFLASVPEKNLTDEEKIEPGKSELKYEDLMNEPEKLEQLKKENPTLYQKLYEDYIRRS